MNFTAIKKPSSTFSTIILKCLWYDIIRKSTIWKQHIIRAQTFYGIVGVFKGVPKNFTNFTGKHMYRIKCDLSMQSASSL